MSFDLDDVKVIESDEDASEEEFWVSVQRAINSGTAWSLQGSYGRLMMQGIKAGRCLLGENECRDYYDNRIPSRSQVEAGTKGSREHVVAAFGEDWAVLMENA